MKVRYNVLYLLCLKYSLDLRIHKKVKKKYSYGGLLVGEFSQILKILRFHCYRFLDFKNLNRIHCYWFKKKLKSIKISCYSKSLVIIDYLILTKSSVIARDQQTKINIIFI